MYYLTGSRCWPPNIPGVSLKKTIPYPYCGAPGASYPEGEWQGRTLCCPGRAGVGWRDSSIGQLLTFPAPCLAEFWNCADVKIV